MANGNDDEVTKSVGRKQPREIEPNQPGSATGGADGETRIVAVGSNTPPGGERPSRDLPSGGGDDEQRTIIHRTRSAVAEPTAIASSGGPPAPASAPTPEPSANDPVTGWLVAIAGPGKGRATPIFEGMNSVGRDARERIPLTFGDNEISRSGHFFVTYEPKKRAFHINHGAKSNLVYVNNEVLLGPMSLNEGDVIEVGRTKLRFVPLCGPAFGWDDAE